MQVRYGDRGRAANPRRAEAVDILPPRLQAMEDRRADREPPSTWRRAAGHENSPWSSAGEASVRWWPPRAAAGRADCWGRSRGWARSPRGCPPRQRRDPAPCATGP
eukprot:scaffold217_cov377-Prasinococcus_capsulatus_cf.AAC.8